MLHRIGIAALVGLLAAEMVSAYNPKADHRAVVTVDRARFSVLRPGVIRMEWSEDGVFTDSATLAFVNRNLPVPEFTKSLKNGVLTIETEDLKLVYDSTSGVFSPDNLSIEVHTESGKRVRWVPGMENEGNLLGTYRTLDKHDGAIEKKSEPKVRGEVTGKLELEEGIISRDGWVLVDDSERPLFDDSDWQWVKAREHQQIDWYFFGYGQDYAGALKDFTAVAGDIPIPPKFVFGVWWSKFWTYTDTEYMEMVQEYENHRLPLDVLVIDMDWHITQRKEWYDENGKRLIHGWTGYSWEPAYFPEPEKFFEWTDRKGLQTCLNLHPADGLRSYETMYPEFAESMGIDPASEKTVEFNITDKKYAENYFKHVIHPLEEQGVDFWWLDWQQWGNTAIPGVNPTFYLNYVHFSDMQKQGHRPLIFHRYGGLGNHRYQIGFSGDTWCTWDSLALQPYFTANAANVGFGYWSHDIGGHMFGEETSELYTRWVQWGLYSPVLRTHATKDAGLERRIWAHPYPYFKAMRAALQHRYELFPYIYSTARQTHETGVSLMRPMYYAWPEEEQAYVFTNQYMFGNDMLVSPITQPMKDGKFFIRHKVWLPEGTWIEKDTGTVLNGGRVVERPYMLDEIPVFVRAGAVIPTQRFPECGLARVGNEPIGDIVLDVYPKGDGSSVLYDDEGTNEKYLEGAFSKVRIESARTGRKQTIKVYPVEGGFPGMTEERNYTVRLHLALPPESVRVQGKEVAWQYDGADLVASFDTGRADVHKPLDIEIIHGAGDSGKLSGRKGQFKRLMAINQYVNDHYREWRFVKYQVFLHDLAAAAQTGRRIGLAPDQLKAELEQLDEVQLPLVESGVKQYAKMHPKKHGSLYELYKATLKTTAK